MKTLIRLLSVLIFASALAAGDTANSPSQAAQKFYDGYMKVLLANGNTEKYVLASPALTKSFKKAYAKLVTEGMDSDPIICGQDYPDEGFSATAEKIKGGKASVTMKSRGDSLKHSFKITLREVDGAWFISDTNDLKADAAD